MTTQPFSRLERVIAQNEESLTRERNLAELAAPLSIENPGVCPVCTGNMRKVKGNGLYQYACPECRVALPARGE